MCTSASYASATLGSPQIPSTFDCNHPFYLHPSDNPEECQREPQGYLSTDNLALVVKTRFNKKNQSQVEVIKKGGDAVVCDFCHMPGHLKDKCYCIHGYPSWHRLFGKPKPKPKNAGQRNSVVENVVTEDVSTGSQLGNSTGLDLSEG
ncbi:hypothetical protein DCAR_0623389 [Daucus carota subsp. sativus]|uniref:Uncharacterized protein n=1 Tax=Daucus carota subsp. sativus TaxID=79200 RepID=A0AAF0XBP1_DAUCS|nr:hypothetical protein DCAR_0623389 [Daucus carota subsp. sativus]